MATLKEIAREAEVSESLVSRFFNQDPTLKIRADKRDRILLAKAKLGGYRSNQAAFSLAKGRAYNFVMPVRSGYSLDWLRVNVGQDETTQALESTLKKERFRLSLTFFQESEKKKVFEDLVADRSYCDGFVLRNGVADLALAKMFKKQQVPHISNDIRDGALGLNVVCDHALDGMRQAFEHLCGLGHRHIGYLGIMHPDKKNRVDHPGIRDELFNKVSQERNLPRDERWDCVPSGTVDNAWLDVRWHRQVRRDIADYLNRPATGRATALIAQDDRLALEFVDVMNQCGLKPGRDISVVGYDNLEACMAETEPVLTTLDTSRGLIGQRSAEWLLEQVLRNYTETIEEHIPVTLVARSSTGPCPKK